MEKDSRIAEEVMEKVRVSVIIPVYNAEKYISCCLDSLLAQSMKRLEIICVDDGSTDGSSRILDKYKKKDERIILMHQNHSYAGAARNHGLKYARGEYVVFLDADDFFERDMMEGMYRKAKEHMADLCICGARFYHEQTKEVTKAPWILNAGMVKNREVFTPHDAAEYLYNFVTPAPWNKMFDRKFLIREGLKFQNTKRSNDLYFTYAAMSVAKTITIYRKKPVYYRVGMSTNLQASRHETPQDCIHALLRLKEELIKRGIFKQFERSYINMALSTCLYNLPEEKEREIFLNAASRLGIRGRGRKYFYNEKEYEQYLEKNQKNSPEDLLVSVVIPMYQKEKKIAGCLDSVLEQTLHGLEILVVDDGSTDHGCRIVERYMKKFHHILFIRQQHKGVGAARNTGISRAHGKYIIFLDADDMVPYDAYEKMYDLIEKRKADAVVGNLLLSENGTDFVIPDGQDALFMRYQKKNCARQFAIPLLSPSVCNKMIYLSLIKEKGLRFSPAKLAEDLEFTIQLFAAADRIYLLREPVYQYITADTTDNSLSKTTSAKVIDSGLMVMKKISLFFDKKGLYENEEDFITGPLAWLWDRFWQIDTEEDKQSEFLRFRELVHNYEGRARYQDAVRSVFLLSAEEFVCCTYFEYLERRNSQTPEELVLKKLQSTQLGFRYIMQCFQIRIQYKLRSGCRSFMDIQHRVKSGCRNNQHK